MLGRNLAHLYEHSKITFQKGLHKGWNVSFTIERAPVHISSSKGNQISAKDISLIISTSEIYNQE